MLLHKVFVFWHFSLDVFCNPQGSNIGTCECQCLWNMGHMIFSVEMVWIWRCINGGSNTRDGVIFYFLDWWLRNWSAASSTTRMLMFILSNYQDPLRDNMFKRKWALNSATATLFYVHNLKRVEQTLWVSVLAVALRPFIYYYNTVIWRFLLMWLFNRYLRASVSIFAEDRSSWYLQPSRNFRSFFQTALLSGIRIFFN